MRKFLRNKLVYLFLLGVIFLPGLQVHSQAVDGVLDLRQKIIDKSFAINLNGSWEFYWDRFVYHEDFKAYPPPEFDLLETIPGYWTDYTLDSLSLNGHGRASYRLLILLPERPPSSISMKIPVFDVSYRLYVNGNLLSQNGEPGISAGTSVPGYKPELKTFSPDSNILEIIIHVSNYQHRRGGFWRSIGFGHPEKIKEVHNRDNFVSNLSLGVLGAFSLFFLVFFIMFRKDLSLLFFSITLLGIFLRIVSTGEFSILIFADVTWIWMIRHEYMGSFIAFLFGMWYFYLLFPQKIMYYITWINTFICSICLFLIWAFEVRIFSYTMLYFQPVLLVFILYYLVSSFAHFLKKKPGSLLYFSGLLIFILALVNDILVANSKTSFSSRYVLHFAVQIMVFLQAVLLIKKWIQAYVEKEKLNKEIEYINMNLEKMVKDRTAELENRNLEIRERNEKIAIQNTSLQDSLDFKNRVFSIIAHDLRSPIASLVQISNLMTGEVSEKERSNVMRSARALVNSAADLIDNLLFWGRSQGNEINFRPTKVNLADLFEGILGLFQEAAKQKSIQIKFETDGNPLAWVDRELIQMVFRNLVSNAIKFTPNGGDILVKIEKQKNNSDNLLVIIRDSGIGMPQSIIQNIYNKGTITSTQGTNREPGTGLGLHLCLDLVKLQNGSLEIESFENTGTNITVILPTKHSD